MLVSFFLINMKITMKKNETSIDCCWVLVTVETNNPKPKITKR